MVPHRGPHRNKVLFFMDWNLNGLVFNGQILLGARGTVEVDRRVGLCGRIIRSFSGQFVTIREIRVEVASGI